MVLLKGNQENKWMTKKICTCSRRCGNGLHDPGILQAVELKDDPAVGTWEMTEVEYAGQTLSADDLKSTGQMDKKCRS